MPFLSPLAGKGSKVQPAQPLSLVKGTVTHQLFSFSLAKTSLNTTQLPLPHFYNPQIVQLSLAV